MSKFKDELPPGSKPRSGTVEAWPAISPQLDQLLTAILDNPRVWLATPSAQFGGKKPGDLIGTDKEQQVIDLLVAVDQGMF
jgi:hypothetical protein